MVNVLFYLLLMFTLFGGRSETVVTPSPATPPSDPAEFIGVPLGEPFALKWGHPGAVAQTDIIVTFDEVVVDPRCPQGETCTFDSPVAVQFTVHEPGTTPAHIVLTAHTDADGTVLPGGDDVVVADKAHGYMFTLLKVTPYPQASDVTPPEDYEAWLRVDPAVDPLPSATAALDTPFTLTPGETIGLDGTDMMVGLLSVDDTRCPIDLACGAGGRNSVAVGLLVLNQYGETEQIKLTGRTGYDGLVLPPTAGLQPEVAVGDYTVKLLRVMPFPQSTDKVTQHDYRVTLSISSSLGTPEPTAEPTVEPTATPIPQAEGEARLGEPFDLRVNESVTVAGEGVQIEFRGVQTDSRCPSDVMCAWSGVVGLQFAATAPSGATGDFVLGGYADPEGVVRPVMEAGVAPIAVLDDYMITITHVRPYPTHHDQTIAPEEYVATLVVTKRK